MNHDTARENLAWARALLFSLARGGVMHAVISPGSRSTPLVLALDELTSLHKHCVLDERVAGFFALGLGRATGRPAVLVCTSGSAAGHFLPAVLEAEQSRVPLIVITADRPCELHDNGALQTVRQRDLFGSHVKTFVDLGAPCGEVHQRWLHQVAARALDAASAAPRGPVHINAPFREPLWAEARAPGDPPAAALRVLRPLAAPSEVVARELGSLFAKTPRGLIVCGPLPPDRAREDLHDAVHALGRALAWPVLAEPTSQVFISGRGSAAIGAYDALLQSPSFAARHAPALILRLGQTPTAKSLQTLVASTERVVLVDEAGAWHDPACVAATLVVADPALFCRALAAHLPRRVPRSSWVSSWCASDLCAQRVLDAECKEELFEGSLARALARALPADAALHVGNSMPIRELGTFAARLAHPLPIYANRGASGIDGTLATAIGEASGDPARAHVVLLGDLAFLHDLGALRAAQELATRLVVVLVDNNGGGIFSHLSIAKDQAVFDSYFRAPQRSDLEALCRACGAAWERVTTLRGFVASLRRELLGGQNGVTVLAATIEQERNLELRARALMRVREALDTAEERDG